MSTTNTDNIREKSRKVLASSKKKKKVKEEPKAPPVPDFEENFEPMTDNDYINSLDYDDLIEYYYLATETKHSRAYYQRLRALSQRRARVATDKILEKRRLKRMAKVKRRLERRGKFTQELLDSLVPQGLTNEMGENEGTKEVDENVTSYTGDDVAVVTVGKSLHETPDGGETLFTLKKFFERPISIYDGNIATGSDWDTTLRVWDLWSKKPAVRAKLSNYAYFKGTMHIRVHVSGTPFHYGTLMFSYQPYSDYNEVYGTYVTALGHTVPSSAEIYPPFKAYLSQAPGVGYVDVKENKPLEMEIPFISPKPLFRLFNSASTVISNSDSFADFYDAGVLHCLSLNQIMLANEDYDSSVAVNIYAWMTDVELGSLTGTLIDITAEGDSEGKSDIDLYDIHYQGRRKIRKEARNIERIAQDIEDDAEEDVDMDSEVSNRETAWTKSGENTSSRLYNMGKTAFDAVDKKMSAMKDEHQEPGPIENIATTVSKVGETLSNVPVIGSFAKATSSVARGVGKVASWFGFSKPVILEKAVFVKNNPFQNGAVCANPETTYKVTVDPKQELTIDPSIGGMTSDDELAITSIASRESFLTTFTWADTATAMATTLWKCAVTPHLKTGLNTMPGVYTTVNQPTPMAFAAIPFEYWRGTITYRFEIVCSKYHRGKLLFRYEPNLAQAALITTGDANLNLHNTTVLDIQNSQELTLKVQWAQPFAWAASETAEQDYDSVNGAADLPDTAGGGYSVNLGGLTPNRYNGFIEVRPLNDLIQPTDLSTVKINVFVSCDDLVVAAPTGGRLPSSRAWGTTEGDYEETSTDLYQLEGLTETLNKTNADTKAIHVDYFGEKVLSFRTLLKRYQSQRYYTMIVSGLAPIGCFQIRHPIYPEISALAGITPSTNIYRIHNSIYQYLRYAFMGMRGGMRYRIIPHGTPALTQGVGYVRVSRLPKTDYSGRLDDINHVTVIGSGFIGSETSHFRSSLEGTVTHHIPSNGGVEFEMPYYSKNLFNFSFHKDQGGGAGSSGVYDTWQNYSFLAMFQAERESDTTATFGIDTAAAEDFTFLRFQGVPFYTTT